MTYLSYYNSPLGRICLAGSEKALTGLWFEGQKHYGSTLDSERLEKRLPVFIEAENWLDIYFGGSCPDFTPPLEVETTEFRRLVYRVLLTIPYGSTMSYGAVAEKVAELKGGGKMSARAVGAAVGRNPISLIIPCHRVIGAKGGLTGYAGGTERKLQLLKLEKADAAIKEIK